MQNLPEPPAAPDTAEEDRSPVRLDAALATRGLARSRTHAAQLVADGLVTVDGRTIVKAAHRVRPDAKLTVAATDHYVSRAAHKLLAALDAFPVSVEDALVLDAGASTGGFTQVLLERGARRVVALDVGHDQLVPQLREDERVQVVEGCNVRFLTPEQFRELTGDDERPSVVVGDLSFISLTQVLPALVSVAAVPAELVLLVKPQFEVGRGGVREGVVTDAALRADAVAGVLWAAWDLGLGTAGLIPSPIVGTHGNREYVVWISAEHGRNPTEWMQQITSMAGA
ncbi:TlyA family RNA methyltransferase [Plantibacter sp. Leaf314]|uniref:TlyA family RNA methyltransferase n=1 Tax=Plantibacter sp. Leaf314 TaxID=1736333 RepID=UPI0006F8F0E7|nr:TlyA family RNA methyltransferase [Plantibacter sp. Leaf314]KQQ50939.1 hemolysin [Plantibacter sp. Leaf314]